MHLLPIALRNIFSDIVGNYALVVFEDEQCTAVVPKDRVINLVRDEDNKCDVKWANKKLYQGKVLLFG